MFLFIFEDGDVKKRDEVDGDDLMASDDGYLDLIDISGETPLRYFERKWVEVESV